MADDTRRLRVKVVSDSDFNKTASDIQGGLKGIQGESTKSQKALERMAATPLDKLQKRAAGVERTLHQINSVIAQKVSSQVDEKGLKRFTSKMGEMADGVQSTLTGALKSSGVYGALAIVAAIVAAAPAAAAALSAVIPLAFGGGVLALGIMAALKDPKVKAAFDPLKKIGKDVFSEFGAAFRGPMVRAAQTFATALSAMQPTFTSLAKITAPLVDLLAPALAAMATNSLPGIKSLVEASVPLFKVLADKAPALGAAFSKFADSIKAGGPGAEQFLKDLFDFLIWVIPVLGKSLAWLSNRYLDWRNGIVIILGKVREAWNGFRTFFEGVGTKIGYTIVRVKQVFDSVRDKTNSVVNAMKGAFKTGVAVIQGHWNKLEGIAKKPINFMINTVYNRGIQPLFNTVAEKFGMSARLPKLQGFARGGVAGKGKGTQDDMLAMLTRGEGILTVKEMTKLGGPKGFRDFRASLAQYNKGGVAGQGDGFGGWISNLANKGKGIVQGIAGSIVSPLVNQLRKLIGGMPGGGFFADAGKAGSNKLLDGLVSWVKGKDKEVPAAHSGMGYKAMQALIKGAFPHLRMISGYRPGARTLSGNLSYHGFGRAVDYPANHALAKWIHDKYMPVTKELITPWNNLNIHNGRPHRYSGAVFNQHNFAGGNAHDHWAMDGVSTVQPGWFMGRNDTGKPETLVNKDLISSGNVYIQPGANLHFHGVQDIKDLRDELIKLGRRNGGRSGLPA